MQGFFNYVNRQLCEYQSIFPDTVQLLDHILFTNGTGLHVDINTGMIYEGYSNKPRFIHEYPKMSSSAWEKLIEQCHDKERNFAERYKDIMPETEEYVAEQCAKYKQVSVDASMFSEEYLYNTLLDTAQARAKDGDFLRPYPLTPGYANIFDLEENTHEWLLEIALNNCKAWERFLTEEINSNNVWINTRSDVQSDYADIQWTTKHRDMIAGEMLRLTKLLNV